MAAAGVSRNSASGASSSATCRQLPCCEGERRDRRLPWRLNTVPNANGHGTGETRCDADPGQGRLWCQHQQRHARDARKAGKHHIGRIGVPNHEAREQDDDQWLHITDGPATPPGKR